jgi:hypothetical protein
MLGSHEIQGKVHRMAASNYCSIPCNPSLGWTGHVGITLVVFVLRGYLLPSAAASRNGSDGFSEFRNGLVIASPGTAASNQNSTKTTSEKTRSPHESPRSHHLFAAEFPVFGSEFTEETPHQTGTNPGTTEN